MKVEAKQYCIVPVIEKKISKNIHVMYKILGSKLTTFRKQFSSLWYVGTSVHKQ